MSNMITQPTELDNEQTIKNKLRKITFHPSQFSSSRLKKWDHESQIRQNLFLKNICKKFAIHQQEIIRQKSSEQIDNQLKDLKHKLRQTLDKENIQKIMSEKQTRQEHYLDKVLRQKTEMVDIGKKYNRKIKMKLTLFNQADQIGSQKGSYRQWYDNNRNSIANSPMYHKMKYLIDKYDTNKGVQSLSNLRNSMDDHILKNNNSAYVKKKRNYNAKPDSNRLRYKQ